MNDSDKDRAAPADEGGPPSSSPPPPGAGAEGEGQAEGSNELTERYLRLAAEFDNYRKRTARERTEVWSRAQADLVEQLVDALDDLARFAHVDAATTNVGTLVEGVDLVERKFWKALERAGVHRIDEVGVPFDPTRHEAVTTERTTDPAQDHTVGGVLQPGYRLGELLIRPARVVVRTWSEDASRPAAPPRSTDAA